MRGPVGTAPRVLDLSTVADEVVRAAARHRVIGIAAEMFFAVLGLVPTVAFGAALGFVGRRGVAGGEEGDGGHASDRPRVAWESPVELSRERGLVGHQVGHERRVNEPGATRFTRTPR